MSEFTTVSIKKETRVLLVKYIDERFEVSKGVTFDQGVSQLIYDYEESVRKKNGWSFFTNRY